MYNDILIIVAALIIWDASKLIIKIISKTIIECIKLEGYIEGANKTQEILKNG